MVDKEIQINLKLSKRIFLNIAKWYLLLGVILLVIGFGASGLDYLGIWLIQSSQVLSVIFGFILLIGAILLVQGVIFVILGISKRDKNNLGEL